MERLSGTICLTVLFWLKIRLIKSRPISRVLYFAEAKCLSFIWDDCHQSTLAAYPPARASNPQTPVYMALQPIRRTAVDVAINAGGLLPHLFTLIANEPRRLFSVTLLCPHKQFPVRKYGALRCPDFPHHSTNCGATSRPALIAKVR